MKKVLESKTKVRFQDCDPFNHLNNSKYIDYFINAREDQLIENYGIDIYEIAFKQKIAWVVATNQISYLKPAFTMENIVIESQLIDHSPKSILVEMRMYNESKTELKSVFWSKFVHINMATQKSIQHSETFVDLFENVILKVNEKTFEERVVSIVTNNNKV
jgi:thioesterase III